MCDWNPTADLVTESLLLGVNSVDEKDAEGAKTVFVELSAVHGMVVTGPAGMMQLSEAFEDKFMILNNDRKLSHKVHT